MQKVRLVRGSEVSEFLFDRMSWWYKWVLHLKKNTPDNKLWFGDLFHKHMYHLYGADTGDLAASDAMERTLAWVDEQDLSHMDPLDFRELMELFEGVSENYMKYYLHKDLPTIKPIATELRFAIPLYDSDDYSSPLSFAYEGTIDLVYEKGCELKFKDYKSVSSIDRYVSNAVLDRQISRYWWALTALCQGFGYIWVENPIADVSDLPPNQPKGTWVPVKDTLVYKNHLRNHDGGPNEFVYDIVRKDVPKPPRELKKGGFSVDKAQNTTYELYVETLFNAGLIEVTEEGEPDFVYENGWQYREVLEHLKAQGNKFLRRIPVRRNWSECQAAMSDFSKAARDMLRVREEVENGNMDSVYWNITWDTPDFNAYFPIIQAEVKGEDVEMVKTLLYKTEERDPEEDYIWL